jgi:hypothetical protein
MILLSSHKDNDCRMTAEDKSWEMGKVFEILCMEEGISNIPIASKPFYDLAIRRSAGSSSSLFWEIPYLASLISSPHLASSFTPSLRLQNTRIVSTLKGGEKHQVLTSKSWFWVVEGQMMIWIITSRLAIELSSAAISATGLNLVDSNKIRSNCKRPNTGFYLKPIN